VLPQARAFVCRRRTRFVERRPIAAAWDGGGGRDLGLQLSCSRTWA